MPSGPDDFPEMEGAFEGHSMAHTWKAGTGFGPAGGNESGPTKEGAYASYWAGCSDCPQAGGWKGPTRSDRDAAQADADSHNESHPGHRASAVAF